MDLYCWKIWNRKVQVFLEFLLGVVGNIASYLTAFAISCPTFFCGFSAKIPDQSPHVDVICQTRVAMCADLLNPKVFASYADVRVLIFC